MDQPKASVTVPRGVERATSAAVRVVIGAIVSPSTTSSSPRDSVPAASAHDPGGHEHRNLPDRSTARERTGATSATARATPGRASSAR